MIAMKETESITRQVLEKITPTREDHVKVDAITRELELKVSLACKQAGVSAIVRVEGSVAKDTWLRENPDIDIFMRLPTSIPRKNLGDVALKIAKNAAGSYVQIERFAEHPYLQLIVKDYRVDIVPCYDAKHGEWQSATDRTPYHTDYINQRFNASLRAEVRLLKRFMKGTGVYGAEIKVGGFSGYLCELLVTKYGSFIETVQAFARYSKRVIIDIENFYAERQSELSLLFPEPLVIVDPVDMGRNVASAVQPEKLYSFVGAARAFLKKPDAVFFYPPKPEALPVASLRSQLESRGASIVFLAVDQVSAVPDVLWGQLYRTKRSLHKLLELSDYKILRDTVWSNEKNLSIFTFELESQVLPSNRKHLGPPLEREAEGENFLSKYAANLQVISGPYIEDGRWIVEVPRKTTNAVSLLKEKLADGGKNAGIAELIAKSIRENLKVLVNAEIIDIYRENGDFAEFLTDFLSGKPFWLKNQRDIRMPNEDYWESAYESGEYKHWEYEYPSPELVALAAANVPKRNARVLDVGSGGGIDPVFMAQRGFRVIGVDVSAAALRLAKKRAEKANVEVEWLRGTVLELPIDGETFDLITDRGLFHLIEDHERARYASEVFRVLKNRGRILIRGTSGESPHDQFNPVTEKAIDKYFSKSKFTRGPVLPIPLFSVEGSMDSRIVMLQKKAKNNPYWVTEWYQLMMYSGRFSPL